MCSLFSCAAASLFALSASVSGLISCYEFAKYARSTLPVTNVEKKKVAIAIFYLWQLPNK